MYYNRISRVNVSSRLWDKSKRAVGQNFLYPSFEALDHAIGLFALSLGLPLRARFERSKFAPGEFVGMSGLDEAVFDAVLGTDGIEGG